MAHTVSEQTILTSAIHLGKSLNVPLVTNKVVGPSTSVVYLGILIDSESLTIRLPKDKLGKLVNILNISENKLTCTKKDLLSSIWSLSFACKVV